MPAEVEREVLGDREREPGREDPLDDRVVGGVEEQREVAGGGALLQRLADHGGVGVRDPDGGEDDANGSPPALACAATWAASSRWGRPPTEKMGSFCPRTSVASPSIAETPVRIGSRGVARAVGLIGRPWTCDVVAPNTGGPPSSGSPRPLHDAAEPALADRDRIGAARERDAELVQAEAGVPS